MYYDCFLILQNHKDETSKSNLYQIFANILHNYTGKNYSIRQIKSKLERIQNKNQNPILNQFLAQLKQFKPFSGDDQIQIKPVQNSPCLSQNQEQLLSLDQNDKTFDHRKIQEEIQNLKKENQKMKEEIQRLKEENHNILQDPIQFIFKEKIQDLTPYHLFYNHFSNVISNLPLNSGNRYTNRNFSPDDKHIFPTDPPDIFKLYAILSFCPPFWYNIIRSVFLLPDLSTAIGYRQRLQQVEHINFAEICQNIENDPTLLKKYIKGFWNQKLKELSDNRVVLAIDAAALKVNYGFDPKTGNTKGLIQNEQLSKEELEKSIEDLDLFFEKYSSKIAKDVFLILLCPLDPKLKPIVLKEVFKGSGSATGQETDLLSQCKNSLQDIGLDVLGFASDGDPQYQSYSIDFTNYICGEGIINNKGFVELIDQVLDQPFWSFNQITDSNNWFSDVLHLLKCHRYHLLSGKNIQVLYSQNSKKLSLRSFRKCFQDVGDPVFVDSKMNKMDDRMVFRLFEWTSVLKAMELDEYLKPILMPSAILLQVFFNKQLTKNERYHMLNIGAAIIYVQRVLQKDVLPNRNTKSELIPPYNKQFMDKYLLLASSLASLFVSEKPFDLADCSSHLVEHLFGTIRRFCAGNDCKERFESSLEKAICLGKWTPDLKIKVNIPGRIHQDKAAVVGEGPLDEKLKKRTFIQYIFWAINFIEECYGEICSTSSRLLNEIRDPSKKTFVKEKYEEIELNTNIPVEVPKHKCTALQIGFINTSGFINNKRYQTVKQSKAFSCKGKLFDTFCQEFEGKLDKCTPPE